MKLIITKLTRPEQFNTVVTLANQIWHEYFTPIIGRAQVEYMLEKFQSLDAITQQTNEGFEYFLLMAGQKPIGYFSYILNNGQLFLSKFYIICEQRNRGYGKLVIEFLEHTALENNTHKISLTINKYNFDSLQAYQTMGFVNQGAVIKDIGNGFIMDDYKMLKKL